ncbi:hypothetical protein CVD28_02520 [Bacillus sp. M6-12]|uniref:hypothetical protein n=1 Tax=Bacillus sp. M6-12 TaxID=2054166 RepID=UPI000C7616F2|nr:hypothetical protein [Bacillus sp. M6-12]PLS19306.1 hypothetical protein CVD28_02520 [Bacillus sp. M6-12]
MIPLKGSKDKKQWTVIRAILLFCVSIYLVILTIQRLQVQPIDNYFIGILGALGILMIYQVDEMIGWIVDNKKKKRLDNQSDNHIEKE